MKVVTLVSGLVLGLACSVLHGEIVELTITASYATSDFDVSSTGPDFPIGDPEGNDDLVFGVAPSDGSTTFTLRVNTAASTGLFPAGYLSGGTAPLVHDMIGYTDVALVGVHTFGSATWNGGGGIVDLVRVDGLAAALWVDTDLTSGSPSRLSFRMFGSGDDLAADLYLGDSNETQILPGMLLWEYFGGEEIRNTTPVEASVPAPGAFGTLVLAGALAGARRHHR